MGRYVMRNEWGAQLPQRPHYANDHDNYLLEKPAKVAIFGNTMSAPCYDMEHCMKCVRDIQLRNIYKYQLLDIRYNFLIDYNGNIYICRGWRTMPHVPKRYRWLQRTTLYVGFIGYFSNIQERPHSDAMFKAKEELLVHSIQNGFLSPKFLECTI